MDHSNFMLEEDTSGLPIAVIKEQIKTLSSISYEDESLIEKIAGILGRDSRKSVQQLGLQVRKNYERYINEVLRVKNMYDFDRAYEGGRYVTGIDEVGRGPLAGPIVAAAVILDIKDLQDSSMILGINDSKKLSPEKREKLSEIIRSKALSFSIAEVSSEEIDAKGIAFCNNRAFLEAFRGLKYKPDLILTDGYPIKGTATRNEFVIKGDTKSASIACASIIAKVYRDNLMKDYGNTYKGYGFENNAGYGTEEHIAGIHKFGLTPIHRKSFLSGILSKIGD